MIAGLYNQFPLLTMVKKNSYFSLIHSHVVFGQFVIGQFVIGQFVIGQFVIGQFVIGQLVIGQFVIGQLNKLIRFKIVVSINQSHSKL